MTETTTRKTYLETEIHNDRFSEGALRASLVSIVYSELQPFFITPGDTVIRNPKSHLITSIQSSLKSWDTANHSESPLTIRWLRRFQYGAPQIKGLQKAIPVTVIEAAEGTVLDQYTVWIYQDGSLSSDKFSTTTLTPRAYIADFERNKIVFKLHDRTITRFEMTWNDCSIIGENGFVRGTCPDEPRLNSYVALSDLETCRKRVVGFKYYEKHRDHLMSFYQNFYDPLFGTTQQDAQKQVKQALQRK